MCKHVLHCRKSVCDVCGHVFSSSKNSKKCAMRKSRARPETVESSELRKACDRERKARKRACESDGEASVRKLNDRKYKILIKQKKVVVKLKSIDFAMPCVKPTREQKKVAVKLKSVELLIG